ncbi:MAG: DJ-1 family glyoxalase III [Candidatus Omnitrophota bacterium]
MSKNVLLILAEGFEDIEAVTAIDILRRAQIEVTVAGLTDIKVKGARGTVVLADKKLNDAGDDFDALILPGGMPGATNLSRSAKVTSLIKEMYEKEKLIAAICAAPAVVLAPLGILKGKNATCYPGMEDSFDKDVSYKEDDVVADKNIITSRGPGTAILFSLKIVEILVGKEVSEKIRKATLVR